MYTRALIQHRTSGEVYVALVDDDHILSTSHPLHYAEWSDDGGITPKYVDLLAFDLTEEDEPRNADDYRFLG